MVTFAQAQERAERWINGDVPPYQHREIRVREFDLGFVVWSEPREDAPNADEDAGMRVVIARDSGEATLWPALPVGELIRRYEEEYGAVPQDVAPEPPQRLDLEATSFLLSPPEWLQEAADRMGIPDRRSSSSSSTASSSPGGERAAQDAPADGSGPASGAAQPAAAEADAEPEPGRASAGASESSGRIDYVRRPAAEEQDAAPAAAGAQEVADAEPQDGAAGVDYVRRPAVPAQDRPQEPQEPQEPQDGGSWAGKTVSDTGEGQSVPVPATVFAPPISGADLPEEPPAPDASEAKTKLLPAGSGLPPTMIAPPEQSGPPTPPPVAGGVPHTMGGSPYPAPDGPPVPLPPPPALAGGPGAGAGAGAADIAAMETAKAVRGNVPLVPAAGGTPPAPFAGAAGGPPPPPPYAGGQGTPPPAAGGQAPAAGAGQGTPPPYAGGPGTPFAGGQGTPPPGPFAGQGTPPPASNDPHYAATMLAGPAVGGPGAGGTPPPAPFAGAAGGPPPPPPYAGGQSTPPPAAGQGTPPPPPPYAGGQGTPPPAAGQGTPPPFAAGQGTPPPGPFAGGQGTPPPNSNDPHYAATMLAGPAVGGPGVGGTPPPAPFAGAAGGPPPPPPYAGGQGTPPPAAGQGTPPPFAGGQGAPPPGPFAGGQGTPPPNSNDPHYAATMLAGPAVGGPGVGGTPPPAPFAAGVGAPPPGYGYPQPAGGVPTVGPGYMAVLRYRGPDGSEQQMIRRSAPGTPHPEWQILHELRASGVPAEQVLELHTELESCDLPGGYCTRMIRESWPQVRISHTAPYGRDHASRRQGVQHLLTHQGELHQVAGAPARPQPQRVPMPDPHTVLRVPPVGLDVIGQELAGAFGPQGVFRFDQRAVSRQGVPDIVAQTLVWAGLPVDFGPFFWAQAQPGQPVPTLAELAASRGVQPSADAGSYLVMGNDFGRQLCVQYGTAHIVALPLEGGPVGSPPAVPQFVNSSLPEFARCMALLGRMWRLRIGLTPEQAGHWTVDFQAQLAAQDPAAIASPDNWWSVLIEQMWDGLL